MKQLKAAEIKNPMEPNEAEVDSLLWNELRNGNSRAFEYIYKSNIDTLYNYGIHIFKDSTLVEDAIQDVFVVLWKRKAFLGDTNSIKFYLRKALKRNIIRKLETKEKPEHRYPLSQNYDFQYVDSKEQDMVSGQSVQDTSKNLILAINSLPERQRDIITYKYFENLSSREISLKMSISLDSTYTLLSRALRGLRSKIQSAKY